MKATGWMPEHTFTSGIEGPAVDSEGNLYAVNYKKEGTIGIVRPDGSHGCFLVLPEGSTGNSIRFGKDGNMYVADYTGHNILKVDMKSKKISEMCIRDSLYLKTYLCTCFTAKRIINQPGVILFIVYFLKIGFIVACFTIHRNSD